MALPVSSLFMSEFKVTVLGSGGAFAPISVGNSAFLVEYKDRRILIDCGTSVPYILRDEMGIPLQSITDIIITHCHADHIGGLEQVLLSHKYMGGGSKPTIWASEGVIGALTMTTLAGLQWTGAGSVAEEEFEEGEEEVPGEGGIHPLDVLAHYCVISSGAAELSIPPGVETVEYWEQNDNDVWKGGNWGPGGLQLTLLEVEHCSAMPATAVRLGPLMVSGDTNSPVLPPDGCQLAFHEAEYGFRSGVHCPLKELYDSYAAERGVSIPLGVWLYHCNPDMLEKAGREFPEEVDGFNGVLTKGQTFTIYIDDSGV